MARTINSFNPSFGNCSLPGERYGGASIGNTSQSPARKTEYKNVKSINASGLADVTDPIGARLGKARQQAMKFIRDALAGELSIDDDMRSRNDHIGELGRTINKTQKAIRDIDSEVSALREKYEVDSDSQEEKDLQFLVDAERAGAKSPDWKPDEEIKERVERIKGSLTEYQERALPLLMERDVHSDTLREAKTDIRIENMTVRDMSVERLKTDPMGEARDNADAVMEAAGREIAGMVVNDAMDHIDKELEKKHEEAEKAEEEKEKLEERIDAAKEKKEEQEELTKEILDAVGKMSISDLDMSDPESEINKLMSKLKLIEFDVKGAVVDEEV